MRLLLILGLLFFNPFACLWAQEAPGNSCVKCHLDMFEDMKTSVHSQQGIYCNSCHGGDPTQQDKDLAKAPATGYIGVPEKRQIAQICGSCHSDVEKMNAYGIRTDQFARYKTSVHGKKLLLEGDTKVAVCSDCHSYHDVVNISDPNSPVYPLNIPNTCNRCHGNEKLMKAYGVPVDMFTKYQHSVHGTALFEKKDLGVATCVSCHGSHGAVPPGVKDIGATCGKCHINENTNFLESAHAKLMEQGKFSGCIACHGNHGIEPVTLNLYTQACGQCHQPNSQAFQEGQKIYQTLQTAQRELQETQGMVKQASIDGIFVEDETALLEEAKTKVFEMGPAQHTLSYVKVSGISSDVEEKITEIKTDIQKKRKNLQWRKLALAPLWIFIFVMIAALWTKYRQLRNH